jgi:hypothetical protein
MKLRASVCAFRPCCCDGVSAWHLRALTRHGLRYIFRYTLIDELVGLARDSSRALTARLLRFCGAGDACVLACGLRGLLSANAPGKVC